MALFHNTEQETFRLALKGRGESIAISKQYNFALD